MMIANMHYYEHSINYNSYIIMKVKLLGFPFIIFSIKITHYILRKVISFQSYKETMKNIEQSYLRH